MGCFKGWTRIQKLTLSWAILALAFFAAGVVLVAAAGVFRMQADKLEENTLRSLVIGCLNLNGGWTVCSGRVSGTAD